MLEATLRSVKSHIEARMSKREETNLDWEKAEQMVDQVCVDALEQCIADLYEMEAAEKANREVDAALKKLFFGGVQRGEGTILHAEGDR